MELGLELTKEQGKQAKDMVCSYLQSSQETKWPKMQMYVFHMSHGQKSDQFSKEGSNMVTKDSKTMYKIVQRQDTPKKDNLNWKCITSGDCAWPELLFCVSALQKLQKQDFRDFWPKTGTLKDKLTIACMYIIWWIYLVCPKRCPYQEVGHMFIQKHCKQRRCQLLWRSQNVVHSIPNAGSLEEYGPQNATC